MTLTEKDKALYEEIKEDVLSGKDITKCDIAFLVKVVEFFKIENKNLNELYYNGKEKDYIKKDKIIKKIDQISKEYFEIIKFKDSFDFININTHRYNAMKLVLEELLNGH